MKETLSLPTGTDPQRILDVAYAFWPNKFAANKNGTMMTIIDAGQNFTPEQWQIVEGEDYTAKFIQPDGAATPPDQPPATSVQPDQAPVAPMI